MVRRFKFAEAGAIPKGNKGRAIKVLVAGVCIVLSVLLARNIFTLLSVEDRKFDLLSKIRKVEEEREELVRRESEVNSPEFIEREARNRLGMARVGEVVVVLPPEDYLRSLVGPLDEERIAEKPNWQKWLELLF